MITNLITSLILSFFIVNQNVTNEKDFKIENSLYSSTSKKIKEYKRGSQYIVTAYRANFYSGPNYVSITKKFLVEGDVCFISKYKNGFGYVVYYNPNINKTTSGWIDLNDLERYNHGC
jgi:hypothetical protein